jgi:HPt (histidine-containing phosphotransfer) domain-containing protein
VLALTANVMAPDQARYMAAGMNSTLAKPVDWPELFNALALYGGANKPDTQNEATPRQGAHILTLQLCDTVAPADTDRPINPAMLNRLRHLQGSTGDLTVKLIELFVRDTGPRLEELHDAVQRADAPSVARLAHAIKGSAANLGGQIMVHICADIETCAEAANLASVPVRVVALQREFTRACDTLTAMSSQA